jgi:Cytochrome c7 and related cytochrome c
MLTLLILGTPAAARGQISPGPLARPHARLEGTLECVKCHAGGRGGGKQEMTGKCLDCHKEIAWLLQQKLGFHNTVRAQPCSSCHPDHAGVDFVLISWPGRGDSASFDHARTGWRLDGSHLKTPCADCHKATFRVTRAATLSQRRTSYVGWVGLSRTCVSCHEDVHRGSLGKSCTRCHNTTDFKTIATGTFDHDRTHYPLRGRHRSVRCEKCHEFSGAKIVTRPFANCTDCHSDAHAGSATLQGRVVGCESCHVVDGWQPAIYTVAQHRLTKYPLEGRHQQVKCADCHVKDPPGVAVARLGSAGVLLRPAFAQCRDCHGPDHGTQLATRADGGACNACHRVDAWTPSSFTVAQHATTRLRLDGRHAEITCSACHGPDRNGLPPLPGIQVLGKAGVAFDLKEVECADCHVDPHKGRFATSGPRAQRQGCVACHDTRAFRPTTADVATHAKFSFALEGAHRATPCVGCHDEFKRTAAPDHASLVRSVGAIPILSFAAKQECAACHRTPHGTQFNTRADRGRCDACHGADAFAPASKFDHTRDATFSTRGAHANVACTQCHPRDPKGSTPNALIYRPVSGRCESCHGKESR